MNKVTKIGVVALFALFLTACDKFSAEQEKADFQKMIEWNLSQEAVLAESQKALQETISTGDRVKIEDSLKTFTDKVDDVLKSLDLVDVKSKSVAQLKTKTRETLTLSNNLIAESVRVMANPTPEAQQVIQEKSQVLIKAGHELQQLQMQLQQKFMPAPAAK